MKKTYCLKILAVAALMMMPLVEGAWATDPLFVPSETYSSIQAAIDGSITNDVIVVSPGIYRENLVVPGYKKLTIRSIAPLNTTIRDTTVIDGDINGDGTGDGRVILVTHSGPTLGKFDLYGVTVRNGRTTKVYGGGDPASYFGAGIAVVGGLMATKIEDCVIEENRTTGLSGAGAGGIYAGYGYSNSTTEIRRCILRDNHADSYAAGGMWLYCGSYVIEDCEIYNNSTYNGGGGLFLASNNGVSKVSRTSIHDNISTAGSGGGIHLQSSWPTIFDDCDIYNNTAPYGSAVSVYGYVYGKRSVFIDTLFHDNNNTQSYWWAAAIYGPAGYFIHCDLRDDGGIGNSNPPPISLYNTILASPIVTNVVAEDDCSFMRTPPIDPFDLIDQCEDPDLEALANAIASGLPGSLSGVILSTLREARGTDNVGNIRPFCLLPDVGPIEYQYSPNCP